MRTRIKSHNPVPGRRTNRIIFRGHSRVSKGVPRQAEVALEVPGRLWPRIILTFGTTRVVGRQPYAPAAFTPGEIPGTHFQGLSRPQGTWFCREEHSGITGNRSRDLPTSSAVP